jgi:hypothetical protein
MPIMAVKTISLLTRGLQSSKKSISRRLAGNARRRVVFMM